MLRIDLDNQDSEILSDMITPDVKSDQILTKQVILNYMATIKTDGHLVNGLRKRSRESVRSIGA